MKLSSYTSSRDNNFNLVRIIAAYAVLVTHSFALATGNPEIEPLREWLGMSIGAVSVDVFFLTSGFLVTASILNRLDAIEFVWARAFRILPGLLVMLLLTVFGLGLAFTTLPAGQYLGDREVYKYLLKCLTLFNGVAYTLPGVFDGNPYKSAVNGSLWTLPFEVRMYALLAGFWLLARLHKGLRLELFKGMLVASAGLAGVVYLATRWGSGKFEGDGLKLFFMFYAGASFHVLRHRITLSRAAFVAALVLLGVSAFHKDLFQVAYMACLAYVVLYFAYVPGGVLRVYNRLGDYSYGVYIYAFPVQQTVAALVPGISVLGMVLLSTVVTFALAVLSWHVVEKRGLRMKERYVVFSRRLLAYARGQRTA